jgi:hypothetical protein
LDLEEERVVHWVRTVDYASGVDSAHHLSIGKWVWRRR